MDPIEATPIAGVYCDGGVMWDDLGIASRSIKGGSWAWCHVSGEGDCIESSCGLLLPTYKWPSITNNYSEYVAALRALQSLPDAWEGNVYTDSQVTLHRMKSPYVPTQGLPDALVKRTLVEQARLGRVGWVLLSGHPTFKELREGIGTGGRPVSKHNVFCDTECQRIQNAYLLGVQPDGGTVDRTGMVVGGTL